ncbi:glyoxalase [Burkholderia mayonis]|uniref:Glyoxalase n=1 Tax=Burkholderia mayonis TaxID=1385591 RepID=A0A1B4FG41_9BURK|nr:VOC family protein [Burkholderia mayonis]AOJ02674.1 glyoxalase [Burkholderia mayonis]KVE45051.1 glyoxalase [Burkholderia mayonis]
MIERVAVQSLRGIAVCAPSATISAPFFRDQWGLAKVPAAQPETVYFRGTLGEQWIYALRDAAYHGIDYLHFALVDAMAVDRFYEQLQADGVVVGTPPARLATPGGGYGFDAIDPEGRRLRFSSDVACHPETEDRVAQPSKISHVVLNSPDLARMERFYCDVLGFRTSDYSGEMMVFLRCTSEHHSIAFNKGPYPSLNHVAFGMPSLDSFMRGIGRMRAQGQTPAWGPGRHGPGDNTFAYFVSPSGFVIEYTSEVQQIDEATHVPKIWPRDKPDAMDQWMTAGPPPAALRAVMQGRAEAAWTRQQLARGGKD